MYKVILAGGMASGKSTVSKMFEAAGGLRFDLDEVSRRLLRSFWKRFAGSCYSRD